MNNLYVYAIGGSGERVVRSLVMLLASGVKTEANKIIPVFVDNDKESKALTRCKDLIQYYNANNNSHIGIGTICNSNQIKVKDTNTFFYTQIDEPVLLDVSGEGLVNLDRVIGNDKLSYDDPLHRKILEERDMLYSVVDRNMPLNEGFVGNPNIGSVVLNTKQFHGKDFDGVFENLGKDDGVIIIGSLFGGTGAAGFPLLVNKLIAKYSDPNERPVIGGIAILPYFNTIKNKDGNQNKTVADKQGHDVHSDTFAVRSRAALMYYDDYMKKLDTLYYCGDNDRRAQYNHCIGGERQDNPVHLVEFLSAVSIVDFTQSKKNKNIVYKEPVFNLKTEGVNTYGNIDSVVIEDVKKSLVRFQLLREIFANDSDGFLKHSIENKNPFVSELGFDEKMRKACASEDPYKLWNFTDNNGDPIIGKPKTTVENEVREYNPAWGLNAFFAEWLVWWNDLEKEGVRPFSIFPNDGQVVDKDNITQKFYSNSPDNFGIAKTREQRSLFSKPKMVAINPDIATYLNNAYKKLKRAKSTDDEVNLASLLKTIYDGLDEVITDKCNI